jgi:glycosyltransferase involved in cell wall biosynthesis
MLPDNTLDIIIPVYNGEAFIVKCLHAALVTANILNANVIVALNKCTDATPNLLSKFYDRRLLIVITPNFLSAAHNFANALNRSKAKYIVLCGADDELNPIGQKKLAQNFMQTATKPFVLYGYDTIVDTNDKPRRSHHAYYSSCFSEHQYVYRSFIAKNPNLNGSWIKRDFFDRVWSQINLDKTPYLERVSDHYFWCFCNCLSRHKN